MRSGNKKSILALLSVCVLMSVFYLGCGETPLPNGGLYWNLHMIGEKFPNAIYMDVYDLDGDGILDIAANNNMYLGLGEPTEESLDDAMVLVYLMDEDREIRETIHLATDIPASLGVKAFDDYGESLIVLGTEHWDGSIYSFAPADDGEWVQEKIFEKPDYYASLILPYDLDNDGDRDIALMGRSAASAPGSWLENTGNSDLKWIAHLREYDADAEVPIPVSGTAYGSGDLDDDGYLDLIYGTLYTDSQTSKKRGEIVAAINPGSVIKESGDKGEWKTVLISDDNYLSADIHVVDIDEDGKLDVVANNIFKWTVTWYRQPNDITDKWEAYNIGVGIIVPGDMWFADMNGDGYKDVIVVAVLGHRGLWLENPGPGVAQEAVWEKRGIFSEIGQPGDFVVVDFDDDGDLDFIGTSMIIGKVIYAEQVDAPVE